MSESPDGGVLMFEVDEPAGEARTEVARSRPSLRRWSGLWPVFLALAVLLSGIAWLSTQQSDEGSLADANVGPAVSTAVAKALSGPAISAKVYQVILPSLVYIRTENSAKSDGGFGVGSGVIVNEDGSILTAFHVVDGAGAISVVFADGTKATAHVESSDPDHDLAVLKADGAPEVIVPAVLGAGAQVGDEAFTVGNPLGLVASLSAGVISGLDRTITKQGGGGTLEGLIQFDAAVNPGNSGGPLLNRAGQVIGIVTALANPSNRDSFTGIGFAVPLGTANGAGGGPPR